VTVPPERTPPVAPAPRRILVCRTDRIGDSVLTLPLCGLLQERFPSCEIAYLGRRYTTPVVRRSPHVQRVIDWDAFASHAEAVAALRALSCDVALFVYPQRDVARAVAAAGIPRRIGTSRRWFHWLWATERVALRRGGSPLHEAQLNALLARTLLALDAPPALETLRPLTHLAAPPPSDRVRALLDDARFRLVVHPLSGGSAPRWPLAHVAELARRLDPSRFVVLVSGAGVEVDTLRPWLRDLPPHVVDATGGTMDELLALLAGADGVLAPSTGPLHLAAALGTRTAGLFPHAATSWDVSRWHPLGPRAEVLAPPDPCPDCARLGTACPCLERLTPATVVARVEAWASGAP
jgi:ADP-heptose:LPS heptosyltransferase